MSPDSLTPIQQKVLAFIAAGYSATAAALQAGVHRNTVANWLKSDAFREALEQSRYEKQLLYWDQAQAVIAEGLNNLRTLMYGENVQPAVRLNATKALLQHVTMYLPVEPGLILPEPAEVLVPMHKNAQPEPAPAAVPIRKPPTPGRNDLCPCGSGLKYKRCCSGKTGLPPAVPPADTA
ncbi:MAG TPA: SEC-C metal-binding domain-containing protein [Bryobacteraceae bacterium]|nr:SEC-C metal-binding domain-containing protein [Bryobacteraceae bacterium]